MSARLRAWSIDAAAALVCALVGAHGVQLLYGKWQTLDPAVFEADTYAQGYRHALLAGSAWPWDLTQDFWPFFFMAPGLYMFLPLAVVAPGGWPALLVQACGLLAGAGLVALSARRARPDAPAAAGLLALAFLLHPAIAVGFAWGWSPYAFAVPLLLAGVLLLEAGRARAGVVALLLAASLKINVAMAVGGLALAALGTAALPGLRRVASRLAVGLLAWGVLSGGAFVGALLSIGRASSDLHLDADARPPVVAGLLSVACVLLPLWPLLRRGAVAGPGAAGPEALPAVLRPLVAAVGRLSLLGPSAVVALLAAGPELAYTILNAANSGLLPATAALFVAALCGLRALPDAASATRAAGTVLLLTVLARLAYHPPVVSPLPLTPTALALADAPPDSDADALRAWLREAPDELPLIVDAPLLNLVGEHPGRVTRPRSHAGGPAVVLLVDRVPDPWSACVRPIGRTGRHGVVFGGVCQALPPLLPPPNGSVGPAPGRGPLPPGPG